MFNKVLLFIWNLSAGGIYRLLFKRSNVKFILPSKEFLISKNYQTIMNLYLPYDGFYGKYESYTYTRSYINRHHTNEHLLGVFRWRGMQENLELILPLVSDTKKVVIDLGGGGCPLGFNSTIIDRLKKDKLGRKIRYNDIKDFSRPIDVVFASHVFEHIPNLDGMLKDLNDKMVDGAKLICFVPSFSNIYWRAGDHKHGVFGNHCWTMGLSFTDRNIVGNIPYYMDIDKAIGKYFRIEKAEYCGDDCIFILACKH